MTDVMKIVGTDGNVKYQIDGQNRVTDLRQDVCEHVTDGEQHVCLTCGDELNDEEFTKCPTITI